MYTDKCSIINVTSSVQFGETTDGTAFESTCRVEQIDRESRGASGTPITHKRLYFLPPNVVIFIGDKIKTTKERGVIITEEYTEVLEVFNVGGTVPHHIEVLV